MNKAQTTGVAATAHNPAKAAACAPSAVTVIKGDEEPVAASRLTLTEVDGVQTMTSLDIVAYINHVRETEGKPAILHKNFLAKVPTVLGECASAEFLAHVQIGVGNGATRQSPAYRFPERETMLMVMSYSYDLQAKVFDAWKAAEAALKAPNAVAIPDFTDTEQAVLAWLDEHRAKKAALLQLANSEQLLSDAAPKVGFYDAVTADITDYTLNDAAKLLGIGRNRFIYYLKQKGYIQPDRVPYQRSIDQGILASAFKPEFVTKAGVKVPKTTYVTSKGLTYFQPRVAAYLANPVK